MAGPNRLPIRTHIVHYRGDDLERTYAAWYRDEAGTATILDTEGWTARMHVRADPDDPAVLVEASTEDGRLTTGIGTDGTREWMLVLHIPGAAFRDLPAGFIGHYDIELTDTAGRKQTFYFGKFRLQGDVTR